MQELQVAHKDAFELSTVGSTIRFTYIVNDSVFVGKRLDGCFCYAGGKL